MIAVDVDVDVDVDVVIQSLMLTSTVDVDVISMLMLMLIDVDFVCCVVSKQLGVTSKNDCDPGLVYEQRLLLKQIRHNHATVD